MDDLPYESRSVSDSYSNIQGGINSSRRTRVLDFHSGRKCPTCNGTGKIPRGKLKV